MEETRAINKIETNLSKEKIEFINVAYTEEVDYWKSAVLEGKNEEERKQLTNQAPSRVFFLARKDAGKGCAENIHEVIFYFKKNYLTNNREQARVDNIPQDDCSISLKNLFKIYYRSRKYEFKK